MWVTLPGQCLNAFQGGLMKVQKRRFQVRKLEQRIAPSQQAFPPGQFPAGNPAQAPGQSNEPGNSGG